MDGSPLARGFWSFGFAGGAVNLASRLEQEAPPGAILISYETFAQVKDTIGCEETSRSRGSPIPSPPTASSI